MYDPGSSRLFVDDISNQRVIIFDGRHPAPRRLFQPVSNAARREFTGIDIDRNHIAQPGDTHNLVTHNLVTGRCEEIDNSKGLFLNL
jgi:hypothetical protein